MTSITTAEIQLRRGNSSSWTSANPTLAEGEPGVELDTNKFKIGDGKTSWVSLAYQGGSATGGGGITDQGSLATNLGSTQTIDFGNVAQRIRLSGTMNADCTVTMANRTSGCQALLTFINDGTGGRALTISDGSSTQSVKIPQGANAYFSVQIDCPDSSNVLVTPLSVPSGLTQADYDTILPWSVPVDLTSAYLSPVAQTGTWIPNHSTSNAQLENISNSSAAQNDSISTYVTLAAGTWSLYANAVKATTCAIATVAIDGTSVGTFDTYNGSLVLNQTCSIAGFSVSTSGRHTFSITAATRNASAVGWTLQIARILLKRTA